MTTHRHHNRNWQPRSARQAAFLRAALLAAMTVALAALSVLAAAMASG